MSVETGQRAKPEPLKLQRCDICGVVAMPDPTIGCRACGWDEMCPILPGETLLTASLVAQLVTKRDNTIAELTVVLREVHAVLHTVVVQLAPSDDQIIADSIRRAEHEAAAALAKVSP